MDTIASSTDLLRIVFLLGAVIALMCKKRFGVTPGGIIIPGLLACTLAMSFVAFVITLVTSVICWFIYTRLIAQFALSSRLTVFVLISLSTILTLLELAAVQKFHLLASEAILLSTIIPGLITLSAKRYGFARATLATLTTTAVTLVAGVAIATMVPYELVSYFSVKLGDFTPMTVPLPYITLPLSILVAVLLYLRFGIRSGGYMIAPVLATIMYTSPMQYLLLLAAIAVSYIMVRVVQKLTLIVGLERFVISLFTAYFVISLVDYVAIATRLHDYRPAPLAFIIVVAVLTNDLSLQPVKKTLGRGLLPASIVSYLVRIGV